MTERVSENSYYCCFFDSIWFRYISFVFRERDQMPLKLQCLYCLLLFNIEMICIAELELE